MNELERESVWKIGFSFIGIILKNLFFAFLILIFLVEQLSLEKFQIALLLIFLVAFFLIEEVFAWTKTGFTLKENTIYYQEGIFNVEKREIPFYKVNTVDLSENLIESFLGLARIKINTASFSKSGGDLVLHLKKDRALEIKNTILAREDLAEEKDIHYEIKLRNLFIYALVSNSIFASMTAIIIIYGKLDDLFVEIFKLDIYDKINSIVAGSIVSVLIIGLMIFMTGAIISIVGSVIKYYKFKVFLENNKLNVSYGLLNRKNYSFDREKIKGIHRRQGVLMQLFGLCFLEIEGIGYGDEDGEEAILYPICSLKLSDEIIENLLPEFKFSSEKMKAPRKSLFRFCFKKFLFATVLAVGVFNLAPEPFNYLGMLLLPWALLMGYLEYKNSAIAFNENLFYASYNSFSKKESIVRIKSIQAITFSQSIFQKRNSLKDIELNIFTNNFLESIVVANLDGTIDGIDFFQDKI